MEYPSIYEAEKNWILLDISFASNDKNTLNILLSTLKSITSMIFLNSQYFSTKHFYMS